MAGRGPRVAEFDEERDYYAAPPRRSDPAFEEIDRRRVVTRSPPPRPYDRTPAFLREDSRRAEAGPMVLRQRDVETFDRHRRSPSPVRVREVRRRPHSLSPPRRPLRDDARARSRTRFVETERIRSPSVERLRSPSPRPIRRPSRPPREPSAERIRTRVVDRERRSSPSSSSSSSVSPAPPRRVRGPTIERDVITHYTDIDHGMVRVRSPSPPPPPRPRASDRTRETDIDISLSRDRNDVDIDVDIQRSSSRSRSRSRHHPRRRHHHHHDDELVVIDSHRHRRAHSAAPVYDVVRERRDPDWDRERELAVHVDIDRGHSHPAPPPPPPPTKEMWTEVSKDLVSREAIETMGYSYEETTTAFYIMDYLHSDAVLQLTEITKDIRRRRRERARDWYYWDGDWSDGWDRPRRHHHHHHDYHHDHYHDHHHHRRRPSWTDERVREQEVIVDTRRPYWR